MRRRQEVYSTTQTVFQAALGALAAAIKEKSGADEPLKGRMVAVVGLDATARGLASELMRRGANVILVSHRKKAAQELAQALGCRHVQFEALYSTMHDVLIVCDEEKEEVKGKAGDALSSNRLSASVW